MKSIVKNVYIILSIIFLLYLAQPTPKYPEPLQDTLQSQEPADTENNLRKAYFTNFNRDEVLDFYQKQFSESTFLFFPIPTYRLNYPPEEAQILIRDQTRSSYLQEIVHPLRESLYINGFIPATEKDTIIIEAKRWEEKIIVKYVVSNSLARFTIGLMIALLGWKLIDSWGKLVSELNYNFRKLKWIFQ
jgi:hypothetical protein